MTYIILSIDDNCHPVTVHKGIHPMSPTTSIATGWSRLKRWIIELEKALETSPVDLLQARILRLEARLDRLEGPRPTVTDANLDHRPNASQAHDLDVNE
jgi:hypothetical protein